MCKIDSEVLQLMWHWLQLLKRTSFIIFAATTECLLALIKKKASSED